MPPPADAIRARPAGGGAVPAPLPAATVSPPPAWTRRPWMVAALVGFVWCYTGGRTMSRTAASGSNRVSDVQNAALAAGTPP